MSSDLRPTRLVIRAYGPLAAIVAVLLVVTVATPSKTTPQADTAAFVPEQAVVAEPGETVTAAARVPATKRATKSAKPQTVKTKAKTAVVAGPAKGSALPVVAGGAPVAATCAGGALQVAGSPYSPACVNFSGDNGGVTSSATFARGMFAYGKHVGEYGQWSFGPNDYTSTDDAREFYYDPRAISAFNGKPGRCVPVGRGTRYVGASWPTTAGGGAPIPPAVAP